MLEMIVLFHLIIFSQQQSLLLMPLVLAGEPWPFLQRKISRVWAALPPGSWLDPPLSANRLYQDISPALSSQCSMGHPSESETEREDPGRHQEAAAVSMPRSPRCTQPLRLSPRTFVPPPSSLVCVQPATKSMSGALISSE